MNQELKDLIKKAKLKESFIVRTDDYIADINNDDNNLKEDGWSIDLGKMLNPYGLEATLERIPLDHHILDYYDLIDGIITNNHDKYFKHSRKSLFFSASNFITAWTKSTGKKRVVITHANCFDGFGVELVALYNAPVSVRKDIEILRLDYGSYNIDELVSIVKDALVFVGDFSFELEDMDKIKQSCDSFYLVDHHAKPFNKATEEYTNCIFDTSKAGAVLAWCFFEGSPLSTPAIIELIGDRDVWNWFHDEKIVKATSALLATYLNTELGSYNFLLEHETLFDVNTYDAYDYLMKILTPYISVIEADDKRISETIENYELDICTIDNIKFAVINYGDKGTRSELCNKLSTKYGMPSFSWTIKNGMFHISLRSTSDDIDVNEIAIPFGGGGHPRASGINISVYDIDVVSFISGLRGNTKRLIKL